MCRQLSEKTIVIEITSRERTQTQFRRFPLDWLHLIRYSSAECCESTCSSCQLQLPQKMFRVVSIIRVTFHCSHRKFISFLFLSVLYSISPLFSRLFFTVLFCFPQSLFNRIRCLLEQSSLHFTTNSNELNQEMENRKQRRKESAKWHVEIPIQSVQKKILFFSVVCYRFYSKKLPKRKCEMVWADVKWTKKTYLITSLFHYAMVLKKWKTMEWAQSIEFSFDLIS